MQIGPKSQWIALTATVITYLIFAFIILIYQNITAYPYKVKSTEHYIHLHEEEITHDIFQNLFAEAALCNEYNDVKVKNLCIDDIKLQLAEIIIEHDFTDSYHVQDLFFVKKYNGTFEKLGWDGELQDITSRVNHKRLRSQLPYWMQFLTRECVYFDLVVSEKHTCEVYKKVLIGSDQTGYVVRFIPLTEEMELPFGLIIPLISMPFIFVFDFSTFAILNWLTILMPIVVGILLYRKLRKKK